METGKVKYTRTRICVKESDLPILELGQLGYVENTKKMFIGNGVKNVDVSTISTDLIEDGAITTAKLANNAIIGDKIKDGEIDETKLSTVLLEKLDTIPTKTKEIDENYILKKTDVNKVLLVEEGATITIPKDSNCNFAINTEIAIVRVGVDEVIIELEEDVAVNGEEAISYKISEQYTGVALKKIGVNNWLLLGNFEEV